MGATIAFSVASGLVGFAVDTAKDLAFSPEMAKETFAYWDAMKDAAFVGAVLAFIVGALLLAFGAMKVKSIIDSTSFDEDT